jgi:hypothetical protein
MNQYLLAFLVVFSSLVTGFLGGAWLVIDVENSCLINSKSEGKKDD